jgi:hypothetical protein
MLRESLPIQTTEVKILTYGDISADKSDKQKLRELRPDLAAKIR